jgi:hypothetical protein
MNIRANAFEADRRSGCHRVRSHSIHCTRSASADRHGSRIPSGTRPDTSHRDALSLSIADVFRFFPGGLTSELSVGRRILRMATAIFKTAKHKPQCDVWQEFFSDSEVLERNHVTEEELEILRDFSPLGVVTCTGDILFILETIRWARDKKPGA